MDSYLCVMRALDEEILCERASLGQFPQLRFESPARFHLTHRGLLAGDRTCMSDAPAQHSLRRSFSVPGRRTGLCRYVSSGWNVPHLRPLTRSDDFTTGTA